MCHTHTMHVPPPERLVLELLDQFRQLTTSQLRSLAFPDAASRTTCDRVLARMLTAGYVDRVTQRRLIGSGQSGSGEYIWQLGSQGHRLVGRDGRWRTRAISYHTLAISDVAVRLRAAERAGEVVVRSIDTEPDCWVTVQSIDLRPDLSVELERPGTGARLAVFIEVDLGTERQSRITEKLTRYMDAYQRATRGDMPELRRIVFVSETQARADEIAWLVRKMPEDQRKYFRSVTLDSFPQGM